ncbi:hypothetical protein ACJMK2_033902 [Sinanodonta woodiana]|uniref:Uncharacterized protein n=1 Tax=Sinanodonta woodiana TaxID=1069815 RepID=A0ABD3WTM6_SINWO
MEIGLLTKHYLATNDYYQRDFGLCENSDFLENGLGPEHPNFSAMNISRASNNFPGDFIPDQRTSLHIQNELCNAQEALHSHGVHDRSWKLYYKNLNRFHQPWIYKHSVPYNERHPEPCKVPTYFHRQNCSFNGPFLHSNSDTISDTLHSHIPMIYEHDYLQNETYPPNPRYLPMLPKTDSHSNKIVVLSNYLTDKTTNADNVTCKDRENKNVSPLNETYLQYIKEFKNDLCFLSQVPNKMSTPCTSPSGDTVPYILTSPFLEGQHYGDAFADNSAKGHVTRHQSDSFPQDTPKRRKKRAFQSEVEEAVYYLTTKYMKYD